jgi:NADPH2:quinone reductase
MQAIYFDRTGEPADTLSLGEFDKPVPHVGEVLVRVLASPIHPADLLFVRGKYRFQPEFPQIAGMEGAGLVEIKGPGTSLATGTLVSFFWRKAWAGYIIVPEKELFVLPTGFPIDKAAQFVLNPFTAWGLMERAAIGKGDWLLVTAGNSAVSRLLIQLARSRGIPSIAVVRDGKYRSALQTLGAEPIDTSREDLEKRVQEITNGKGVLAALDPIGGPTATAVAKSMAVGGKIIAYANLSPEPLQIHNSLLVYKFVSLSGFGVRSYMDSKSAEEKKDIAQQLVDLLGKDDFELKAASHHPLASFKAALQEAAHGSDGKVLLKP